METHGTSDTQTENDTHENTQTQMETHTITDVHMDIQTHRTEVFTGVEVGKPMERRRGRDKGRKGRWGEGEREAGREKRQSSRVPHRKSHPGL